MNAEQIKTMIIERVTNKQGMKATQLAAEADIVAACTDGTYLIDLVTELVETGQLLEIEYILPDMNYRVKSFYLPAGAKVQITSKKD